MKTKGQKFLLKMGGFLPKWEGWNLWLSCKLAVLHMRASTAPFLRKCGNLPIQEILVITSPYIHPSNQPPVCPHHRHTNVKSITQSAGMATQIQLEVDRELGQEVKNKGENFVATKVNMNGIKKNVNKNMYQQHFLHKTGN